MVFRLANESAKKEASYSSASQFESQVWTIHLSDLFYGSLETVAPGNKIYMDHLYLLKREAKRASGSVHLVHLPNLEFALRQAPRTAASISSAISNVERQAGNEDQKDSVAQ